MNVYIFIYIYSYTDMYIDRETETRPREGEYHCDRTADPEARQEAQRHHCLHSSAETQLLI